MAKKVLLILGVCLLILLFLGSFWFGCFLRQNFFQSIADQDGRTNFFLLGINGSGAIDTDLTDTMIFVSINSRTGKLVLLSIPRDLWIKEIQAKVNTAYHYGGFDLAKKTALEVLGQKIDYILVLNFDGFEKAIDILGGIEVEVDRSFDDYKYPIEGKEKDLCDGDKEFKCRYEHVHFEAGWQKMDGATALKFVRSRNAEGDEGTDFARSQRQQKLISSFRNELVSPDFYLHLTKVYQLGQVFQASVKTDIERRQYGSFLFLIPKINWKDVKSNSLIEDLLIHPKSHYSKQWVLVPKSNDWKEIQGFVGNLLK